MFPTFLASLLLLSCYADVPVLLSSLLWSTSILFMVFPPVIASSLPPSDVPVVFCLCCCQPFFAIVIFTDKSLYLCSWSLCFGVPALVGVTAISSVPTVANIPSATATLLFFAKASNQSQNHRVIVAGTQKSVCRRSGPNLPATCSTRAVWHS